jgi:hypothetical protein
VALYQQQAHSSIINAIDGCGGMDIGNGAPEIVTGVCVCVIEALPAALDLCPVCHVMSCHVMQLEPLSEFQC